MDARSFGLVFGAAIAAGIVNSVAGGGTMISFPAAVAAGLSTVVANATNCIALAPGALASAWAYRRELSRWGSTTWLVVVATASGGLAGAAILLVTPERWFDAIVPWLVFGATLLIVLQGPIARVGRGRGAPKIGRGAMTAALFGVGIYGGYFGAGQGIFMLGVFSLFSAATMHEMNALKVLAAAFSNGFAAAYFLVRGVVDGPVALVMTAGAIAGGFAGASIARRVDPRWVRGVVVAIGLVMTLVLLRRAYHRADANRRTDGFALSSRSTAARAAYPIRSIAVRTP